MKKYLGIAAVVVTLIGLVVMMRKTKTPSRAPNSTCIESVEDREDYEIHYGWYKCNPIQRGDHVLYRLSAAAEPELLTVRGAPGDHFRLVRSAGNKAWNIEVNGSLLMRGEAPLRFGSSATPVLSLYEKANSGKLDDGSVLLFNDKTPGLRDSGKFGVFSTRDVVAKVLSKKETTND